MSTVTIPQTSAADEPISQSALKSHRPDVSALLVFLGDILGLKLSLWLFLSSSIVRRDIGPDIRLQWWLLLPLMVILYGLFESYPGVNISPVDEIRRISLASTCGFLCLSTMFAFRQVAPGIQPLCILACVATTMIVLAFRAVIRRLGSKFEWWGYPIAIIGSGEVAQTILRRLNSQPHLGLRPAVVVSDEIETDAIEGVPVWKSRYLDNIASCGVDHAIVAAPELSQEDFVELIRKSGDAFPHLIIIPDTELVWKVGSFTRDLMGFMGLQVGNNLLNRGSRVAKRAIDLVSAALLILLILPLMLVISILIVADSGLPVFYRHRRLGRGGKHFLMWKFRTMMNNSTYLLDQSLSNSDEMRKEWTEGQKIRRDPRVTPIGQWLRKTSLDEVPQLWNVIMGHMALVGPRPIVDAEVAKYRQAYSMYIKTTPGLTGLWQVSGRSRTTYEERVAYDTYYVRNWSVWLDVYLLIRSAHVVLTGHGAY